MYGERSRVTRVRYRCEGFEMVVRGGKLRWSIAHGIHWRRGTAAIDVGRLIERSDDGTYVESSCRVAVIEVKSHFTRAQVSQLIQKRSGFLRTCEIEKLERCAGFSKLLDHREERRDADSAREHDMQLGIGRHRKAIGWCGGQQRGAKAE
jgi:hypothetical protein